MLFVIMNGWSDDKPIETAQQIEAPRWDTRTCSEKEFNRKLGGAYGEWRSMGTEHTVLPNGYIRRQIGTQKAWIIEIASLEELRGFMQKHPKFVLELCDGEPCFRWNED